MQSHCIHTICKAFFPYIDSALWVNEEGEGSLGGVGICITNEHIVSLLWVIYWLRYKIYMGDMFLYCLLDLEISYCYFTLSCILFTKIYDIWVIYSCSAWYFQKSDIVSVLWVVYSLTHKLYVLYILVLLTWSRSQLFLLYFELYIH